MNIFREALEILNTKRGDEMSEEELKLINTAIIPLMVKTDGIFPEDSTIGEGLEELTKIVEERAREHEKPMSIERANGREKPTDGERARGVGAEAPVNSSLPGSGEE